MTSQLVTLEPTNRMDKVKYQHVNETLPKLIGEYSIKYLNDFASYFNDESIYEKLSTDPTKAEHEVSLLVDDVIKSKHILLYSDNQMTFVRARYLRDVAEYDKLDKALTSAFKNHRIGDYRRIKRAIENAEIMGIRGAEKVLDQVVAELNLDAATCSVPDDDDLNVMDDNPKSMVKQRPRKKRSKTSTSAFVIIGGGLTLAVFAYYMQRNHKRGLR